MGPSAQVPTPTQGHAKDMRWRPSPGRTLALALALGAASPAGAKEAPFGAVSLGELRASPDAGVPDLQGAPLRAPEQGPSRVDVAAKAYPYALLSSKVYKGQGDEICPVIARRHDENSGFDALSCRDEGSDRVVVVFRGTDQVKDWVTADLVQPLTLPLQYKLGLDFAAEMKDRYGDVAVTGHSLGGGIAQYAGTRLGLETWTFNPAGLGLDALLRISLCGSKGTCPADASRVTNVIVAGEPLEGARVLVPLTRLSGASVHFPPAGGGVTGHGMGSVLASLESAGR